MATALPFPPHRHPPRFQETAEAGVGSASPSSEPVGVELDVNPDGSLRVEAGEDFELRVTPTSVEYVPTTEEHMAMAAARRFLRNPIQPLRDELYRNLPLTEIAKARAGVSRFRRDPFQGARDQIYRSLPLTQLAKTRAAVSRFVRDPTVGIRDEIKRSLPLTEAFRLRSDLRRIATFDPMKNFGTIGHDFSLDVGGGRRITFSRLRDGGWTAGAWGDGWGGSVTRNKWGRTSGYFGGMVGDTRVVGKGSSEGGMSIEGFGRGTSAGARRSTDGQTSAGVSAASADNTARGSAHVRGRSGPPGPAGSAGGSAASGAGSAGSSGGAGAGVGAGGSSGPLHRLRRAARPGPPVGAQRLEEHRRLERRP